MSRGLHVDWVILKIVWRPASLVFLFFVIRGKISCTVMSHTIPFGDPWEEWNKNANSWVTLYYKYSISKSTKSCFLVTFGQTNRAPDLKVTSSPTSIQKLNISHSYQIWYPSYTWVESILTLLPPRSTGLGKYNFDWLIPWKDHLLDRLC